MLIFFGLLFCFLYDLYVLPFKLKVISKKFAIFDWILYGLWILCFYYFFSDYFCCFAVTIFLILVFHRLCINPYLFVNCRCYFVDYIYTHYLHRYSYPILHQSYRVGPFCFIFSLWYNIDLLQCFIISISLLKMIICCLVKFSALFNVFSLMDG